MNPKEPPDPVIARVRRSALMLAAFAVLLMIPPPVNLAVVAAISMAGLTRSLTRSPARSRVGGGRAGQGRLTTGATAAEPSRARDARGSVALGIDARGQRVTISEAELAAHGLIVGASGSGKTTTLMTILEARIAAGLPVVAIDLKGSPDFTRRLEEAAGAAGRRVRVWTPDGPASWNPLAYGNATELKDKLLATEHFTEPHYKRSAERYLQRALGVLTELHPDRPPTFAEVVDVMDPGRLQLQLRGLSADRAEDMTEYLSRLTRDQESAIRGLGTRLAILTESQAGPFLGGADAIDLRRALEGEEIVVFSLNSSRYGQMAAGLGALAVQDVITAAGARQARAGDGTLPLAMVAIDEFSALGQDNVVALFARGREAGVSVMLATQELADMDRVSHGLRDAVVGSTVLKIFHRQDVAASARYAAELGGTDKAWEWTHRNAGLFGIDLAHGTRRLVDRFHVEPETIRTLRTGEAMVIRKSPQASTMLVRVINAARDRPARSVAPGREASTPEARGPAPRGPEPPAPQRPIASGSAVPRPPQPRDPHPRDPPASRSTARPVPSSPRRSPPPMER